MNTDEAYLICSSCVMMLFSKRRTSSSMLDDFLKYWSKMPKWKSMVSAHLHTHTHIHTQTHPTLEGKLEFKSSTISLSYKSDFQLCKWLFHISLNFHYPSTVMQPYEIIHFSYQAGSSSGLTWPSPSCRSPFPRLLLSDWLCQPASYPCRPGPGPSLACTCEGSRLPHMWWGNTCPMRNRRDAV